MQYGVIRCGAGKLNLPVRARGGTTRGACKYSAYKLVCAHSGAASQYHFTLSLYSTLSEAPAASCFLCLACSSAPFALPFSNMVTAQPGEDYLRSKDALRLPPFDGAESSWRQWSAKFLSRATLVGTSEAYTEEATRGVRQLWSAEKTEQRKALEAQAYAELLLACSDIAFYIVDSIPEGINRPYHAWSELKQKYSVKSSARKVELRRLFASTTMSPSQDPDDFILQLEYIRRQLRDNGVVINDADFVTDIVVKLPSTYSELVTNVELRLDRLTLSDLQSMLRAFYRRKIRSPPPEESALHAKPSAPPTPSAPSAPTPARQCTHCHKTGHTVDRCWALHGKPDNLKKRRGKHRKPKATGAGSAAAGSGGAGGAASNLALMAAAMSCVGMGGEGWIVDTGATSHMTGNSDGMVNIRPYSSSVKAFDGSHVQATHIGDLPCYADEQGITLYDVLVVPSIGSSQHLFSVRKATNKGVEFHFGGSDGVPAFAKAGNVRLDFSDRPDGLWELRLRRGSATPAHSAHVAIDIDLLHHRMGHLSHASAQQLATSLGMTVEGTPSDCVPCELGKSSRTAVNKETSLDIGLPLQLVYTDFTGPFRTASIGGSWYAHIFIDHKTRLACLPFHKTKSSEDAAGGLELFNRRVVLPSRYKLQTIRSDCGGEFTGEPFARACADLGVAQQFAPAHTQQLNGVAERALQTLIQRASCMLHHAGVGEHLWAEALSTACYLYNRSPHTFLDGMTPFQAFTGSAPSLDHLRVFGCLCFVHVPKPQRGKLDARATPAIFVGYAINKPDSCYRVYIPSTRKVIESIHVSFHEGTMYMEHASGGKPVTTAPALLQEGADSDQPAEDSPALGGASSAGTATGAGRAGTITGDGAGGAGATDSAGRAGTTNTNTNTTTDPRGPLTLLLPAPQPRAFMAVTADPSSYKEALACPEADQWRQAMAQEMTALIKMGTWDVVELPPGRKAIGTKWVFKAKTNSSGVVVRYKARLVVQGFSQIEGVDYFDTYAPVANITTVRTLLAVAAMQDWELEQMDVDTAFLNAPVNEELYAAMPPGYQQTSSTGKPLVYKLRRSLYGLKQAPKNWNSVFNQWLLDFGFDRSVADPCLYSFNSNSNVLHIALYVDDLIIASDSVVLLADFKQSVSAAFSMKQLGQLEFFLGIRITRDRASKIICLDQSTYIDSVLSRFGMSTCKPLSTPATTDALTSDMSPSTPAEVELMSATPYRSAVGSLLYAAVVTRPDISNAVRCVSRYMNNPGPKHWAAVKRILRYLKGTSHYQLVYDFSDSSLDLNNIITGYSDSDHAGDLDSRRSTTGFVFQLGSSAISWCSRLQPTVALSSTEAEYMALTEAINEAIHLRHIFNDLQLPQSGPTVIFEDNQGALKLACNPMHHRKTKHIDVRYHHIRHHITTGTVQLAYIHTSNQLADCLTKNVDGNILKKFVTAIFTSTP